MGEANVWFSITRSGIPPLALAGESFHFEKMFKKKTNKQNEPGAGQRSSKSAALGSGILLLLFVALTFCHLSPQT